jgi:hypothetical protein
MAPIQVLRLGSPELLPETFGRIGSLFDCGRSRFFRLALVAQRGMNRPFQLGRSGVDGFSQGECLVADFERLERTEVSFHATAHVAIARMMGRMTSQMHFDERHSALIVMQRPLDYALDPKDQFLAAVDVLVRVDSNFHLGSAQPVASAINVAKNMPHGHPPFRLKELPL